MCGLAGRGQLRSSLRSTLGGSARCIGSAVPAPGGAP
ncbi:hypothetical protein STRAU_6574 [Streptomyces aurantiacus JA 4570]|uniref:Uncharacterized protein n=1 Tax=Streptomyces aurantiacus JA 4570 TaxID=1286094 RepID=S3Z9B6_9ACTN|nr:hypothetical protein STRAU_6574 [Streptomyces aurantiacus JA 4570]